MRRNDLLSAAIAESPYREFALSFLRDLKSEI